MFRWIAALRAAIRSTIRRKRVEAELNAELQDHLDRQIDEELRKGLTMQEARYAAMRAMGPMSKSIEECRDVNRLAFFDDLTRDLTYAARTLRRNRGFAAIVLTSLAIAIGAVVTVFSIVDAWLLRPLNFPHPDRLAIAFAAQADRPAEPAVFLPYRVYLGWKERSGSFESLSAAFPRDVTLVTATDAQSSLGLSVTPEFFRTFDVAAFLGRRLVQEDFAASRVVVLSYGLWQRGFGSSRDVVGKTIRLSGVPHVIVGVMPQDFETRVLDMRFDFWTTLAAGEGGYTPTGVGPVAVVGRLRNGVSLDTARTELQTIYRAVESASPIVSGMDFNRFVVNLSSLQADNTRTVRLTLLIVSAAVGSLLLIASMNVGTLLLGRGLVRLREAAIRTAIGSGRGRIIRQLFTESLLIAVLGGAAGLGLAAIAIRLFVAWNPLGALPQNSIRLDLRVLGAAFIAIAITTVVCGLMPALRIAKTSPYAALSAGGERGPTTLPGQRMQMLLLAAQMSTSVILLVATMLLVRTFVRLESEHLGFDPSHLSVANVVLPNDAFGSSEKRNIFYSELAERVRSLPGVRAVAGGTARPLFSGAPTTVNTTPESARDAPRFSTQEVTAEFFDTLAIPIRAGRIFDARDSQKGTAVAILNTRAAEQLFGSPAAAIGRRVRLDREPWREVVGVVDSVRSTFFNTLEWQMVPIVYRPAAQSFNRLSDPTATSFSFQLHVRSDRELTLADIRLAAAAIDSQAAVTEVRTVPAMVNEATRQPAFRVSLLFGFAAVSLFLAATGVYGLVAQAVTQRRREVALRVALGARRAQVIVTVSRRAFTVTMIGFGIGIVAALMLGQALESRLYGVRPRDITSFVTAGALLLAAAALAAFVPALRATRVDPAKVLNGD
jgi:putative ABC transport system permease protein